MDKRQGISMSHLICSVWVLLFALVFSNQSQAAEFCVTTPAELQAALTTAAANGEDDIIRLVQGTYVGNFVYASFEANSLTLEGGYTTGCASRTIDPANTVLDGNGTGNVLVISTDKATPAKMEGLTLQNGVASNNDGGGIYFHTDGGSLDIYGCVFTGNSAREGGGVYADASSGTLTLTLTNNTFTGNSAYHGGGVYADSGYYGTLTLTNNTFTGNSAREGGGVYSCAHDYSGTLTLTNNTFTSNSASSNGGGVYAYANDCFIITLTLTLTLTNNTFTENSASWDGGGGGGVYAYALSVTLTLTNNTFTGNSASYGDGGGVYALASSGTLTLTDNTFTGNSASRGGGVYADASSGTLTLTDNTFTGNSASWGGGVYAYARSVTLTLTNNTFTGNSAFWDGGGVYAGSDTLTLTNNTFYANQATREGGAIRAWLYDADSIARIYNNLLWVNTAPEGADLWIDNDGGNDFLPSPVELFNNDFDQSPAGTWIKLPFPIDPSNLNKADPLFVDAANGDLHLSAGSPCIDAGDNNAPDLPETDKDGQPRIMDGVVDMGAYEYPGSFTPVADFAAGAVCGDAPLEVVFQDLSIGQINTWEWDFGDGGTCTEQHPVHVYTEAGTYTVSLTVTGPNGSDTETRTDYITVTLAPPVPDIKANGEDSLLIVMPGEAVDILVSLDPGSLPGQSFDWWIGAFTPFGNYWLTPSLTWVKSDVPIRVAGRGLFPVSPTSLLHMPLPVGPYMFFFLLDAIPDGMLNDLSFYDLIDVVCQPAG